jgi:hypothetical protein
VYAESTYYEKNYDCCNRVEKVISERAKSQSHQRRARLTTKVRNELAVGQQYPESQYKS